MYYNCAYFCSFSGFAEDGGIQTVSANIGEVYQGLSIIEQDPLEGYKATPSPLSFKLLLVVLWWIVLFMQLFVFRAKHNGVSNPSLGLSYHVSAAVELLSLFIFVAIMAFYSLIRIEPYFI